MCVRIKVIGHGAVLRVNSTRAVGTVAAVATIWGRDTRIAVTDFLQHDQRLFNSLLFDFVDPAWPALIASQRAIPGDRGGRGMDSDELVSILKQKFPSVDREVIRAVLEDNDNRLAAAEEALRAVATRQGSSGTGTSGRPVRYESLRQISA